MLHQSRINTEKSAVWIPCHNSIGLLNFFFNTYKRALFKDIYTHEANVYCLKHESAKVTMKHVECTLSPSFGFMLALYDALALLGVGTC